MNSALSLRGLSVSYGGVKAVVDVDLEVGDGEIVGLIGPNGAGKTSLIDAITGFAKCTGDILVNNIDLSRMSPYERARCGLGRTWQAVELFDDLTVGENLAVAEQRSTTWQTVKDRLQRRRAKPSEVGPVLDRLGMRDREDAQPDQLSQGERKLVGVGRALMGGPRVVLLDEPAAGLDTQETQEFSGVLRKIASDGLGILLVDHDMGLVLSLCHRIVVMDFGFVIGSGTPKEVQEDPVILEAYLGTPDGAEIADTVTGVGS